MDSADLLGSCKIGDRPGHADHSMKPSSRQAHCSCCIGKQFASGIVRCGNAFEQFTVGFGVRPDARPIVAIGLTLARGSDAVGDFRAAFSGWRQREIGR